VKVGTVMLSRFTATGARTRTMRSMINQTGSLAKMGRDRYPINRDK
jgi:cytochrome c556